MRHIVFFSSGIGSWAAAKRVAEQHGTENLVLLFADTGIEDQDNYRFLLDAADSLLPGFRACLNRIFRADFSNWGRYQGNENGFRDWYFHKKATNPQSLVDEIRFNPKLMLSFDGRPSLVVVKNERDDNVFENWKTNRAIANNRMPFCSFDMKHKPCRDWLKANSTPEDIYYVGIGWDEVHRLTAIKKGWAPNKVIAPMTEAPYLDKTQVLTWAASERLTPPRLYSLGFPHANCGGGCVRAGHAHWRHLLKTLPDVFARWESEEIAMQRYLGRADVAILKRSVNGEMQPYTLTQLRQDVEASGQLDLFDWGGCGCFAQEEA